MKKTNPIALFFSMKTKLAFILFFPFFYNFLLPKWTGRFSTRRVLHLDRVLLALGFFLHISHT